MENILSDGEISNDSGENDRYSIISSGEDEYFNSLTNVIKKRQYELEVENAMVELQRYDDYAKENRFGKIKSSRGPASKRAFPTKLKRSEVRNRSFRASSVMSNYSMPKRKRNRPQKKKVQKKRPKYNSTDDDDELIDLIEKSQRTIGKSDSDDDEDCELITLRLNALKSKQEFKDPDLENSSSQVPEEELLRIDALKSALLKRRDHFMEKKRKRKLENERPYSPSDHVEPYVDRILEDDPMELSCSPLNSPLTNQDDVNQMDMEISSPEFNHEQVEENGLSDMEIASSPTDKTVEQVENELEDENELRSMLLSSISTRRKDEQKSLTKNLKLAVERIRQAHQKQASPPPPAIIQHPTKSGTKTIQMILEEKKNKKVIVERPKEFEDETENILLNKITTEQNEVIEKLPTPPVVEEVIPPENYVLYSSISDTKNIPLLSREANKTKNNRMITSFESVKRPVEPLIITVNAESSDDDQIRSTNGRMVKKTHRKIVRVTNVKSLPKNSTSHQIDIIEKQVENILRKIRLQSEKDASQMPPTKSSNELTSLVKIKSPIKVDTLNVTSAVNHLPKSAQIEYAMLKEKMKKLEEAKMLRHKSRQLKRQKSSSMSKNNDKETSLKETEAPKMPQTKTTDIVNKNATQSSKKIEDTLGKIQQLDENARDRLASNAENKYLSHSKNLNDSLGELVKLIDSNSLEIKRKERIDDKIAELEKTLTRYRTMKKIVDQRINVGIPHIIRSQEVLIKIRNNQHNFGSLCLRVGKIVRGPDYSLPNGLTREIHSNMSSLIEKCDKIQNKCRDHFAINHFKSSSQKIKTFVSATETEDKNVETKENKNDIVIEEVPIVPESAIEKRLLVEGSLASKRVKYESPLEFLKRSSANEGENSEDNLNKVVCPFALENSCTDSNCKMLHI